MQQTLHLPNPQDWLSVGQAVDLLKIDRSTLYVMIADGRLGSFKIGAQRVIWKAQALAVRDALQLTRRPRG